MEKRQYRKKQSAWEKLDVMTRGLLSACVEVKNLRMEAKALLGRAEQINVRAKLLEDLIESIKRLQPAEVTAEIERIQGRPIDAPG